MPFGKPVPAVKGGAVATLVEYLIAQNEVEQCLNLNVFSVYDSEAVLEAKKYSATNFSFLKRKKWVDGIDSFIDSIVAKIRHKKALNHYLWKLYVVSKLKKFLIKNNYDRVVFQNSGYLLLALKNKKVAKKYKGKLYYHLHNDIPKNVYVNGVKQCKLLLISKYLEKQIASLCGENILEQCYIVKNGFDTTLFAQELSVEEKVALKINLNIDNSKKIILFTGRLTADKGVDKLVDAVISLNRDDIILLIVGSVNFDSDETSDFEKNLRQKVLLYSDKIRFTGYVPYRGIWKYYKLADVAVLPSVWEEPAGLTMIEACAAATPLITTKSGGIPEYIHDDFAILLERDENLVQNIAKSINMVLANEEVYRRKAHQASLYVKEHFSKEVFYNTFVKVLE